MSITQHVKQICTKTSAVELPLKKFNTSGNPRAILFSYHKIYFSRVPYPWAPLQSSFRLYIFSVRYTNNPRDVQFNNYLSYLTMVRSFVGNVLDSYIYIIFFFILPYYIKDVCRVTKILL